MNLYVGTSGYSYKEWKGNFYPDRIAAARALGPIHERAGVGRAVLLFEAVERDRLAPLGEVRTPSVADLFVAILSGLRDEPRGAGR